MRNRVLLLCLVSGLLLVPRVNWAADKCFLYLAGIPGESQDKLYVNWIDIESWSWGESKTGIQSVGGGGGTGKISSQDFHFVMKMGIASPLIMSRCSSGMHIPEARLVCRKDTGKIQYEYLRMLFQDINISSYQTGGSSSSGNSSIEQISFKFSQISMEFRPLLSDGSVGPPVQYGFDFNANKSLSPGSISGSGSGAQGGGSSSGGAAPGQVPPAATSPVQTPVKATPSILTPQRIKAK
jgi:type VI secretion system secreted protein Hcp